MISPDLFRSSVKTPHNGVQRRIVDSRPSSVLAAVNKPKTPKGTKRDAHSTSSSIRVFCKFRDPPGNLFSFDSNGTRITYDDHSSDVFPNFEFERVFAHTETQEALFQCVGRGAVDHFLKGYNASVVAYGQSGSGKTFCMLGTDENPGIVPRALAQLFVNDAGEIAAGNVSRTFKLSVVELYKEDILDLLAPNGGSKELKIKERIGDRNAKVYGPERTSVRQTESFYIDGAVTESCNSLAGARAILDRATAARKTARTGLNFASSRSHLIIEITACPPDDAANISGRSSREGGGSPQGRSRQGPSLMLADLAGSERQKKSLADGDSLLEGAKINHSLAAFGNIIHALTTGQSHIPYRDSKLTKILLQTLGGDAYSYVLVTVAAAHPEETLNTLKFAARSATVTCSPTLRPRPLVITIPPEPDMPTPSVSQPVPASALLSNTPVMPLPEPVSVRFPASACVHGSAGSSQPTSASSTCTHADDELSVLRARCEILEGLILRKETSSQKVEVTEQRLQEECNVTVESVCQAEVEDAEKDANENEEIGREMELFEVLSDCKGCHFLLNEIIELLRQKRSN